MCILHNVDAMYQNDKSLQNHIYQVSLTTFTLFLLPGPLTSFQYGKVGFLFHGEQTCNSCSPRHINSTWAKLKVRQSLFLWHFYYHFRFSINFGPLSCNCSVHSDKKQTKKKKQFQGREYIFTKYKKRLIMFSKNVICTFIFKLHTGNDIECCRGNRGVHLQHDVALNSVSKWWHCFVITQEMPKSGIFRVYLF